MELNSWEQEEGSSERPTELQALQALQMPWVISAGVSCLALVQIVSLLSDRYEDIDQAQNMRREENSCSD